MAIKSLLLIITTSTLLYAQGLARFDNNAGTVVSPFTSPVFQRETPSLTFEFSATNYYSFSPVISSERLIGTDWGVMWGEGKHRWNVVLSHLDAFGIYQEFSPGASYGIALGEKISFAAQGNLRILHVPTETDVEFDVGGSFAFHHRSISMGVQYDVSHLSKEPERSIPLGEFSLRVLMRDNKFGSQGIGGVWNHTDKEGYITISQVYPVTEWLSLSAYMQSHPFTLGLSFTLTFNGIRSGFLFLRHPDLGWSHSGVFQISPGKREKKITTEIDK